MSEYVFRYASGYGCDMSALMDGGRQTVGEYFALDATDHYGTLHEEIVRCRDCVNADYAQVHMFDGTRPMKWGCARFEGFHFIVPPDGFCAWGERRQP